MAHADRFAIARTRTVLVLDDDEIALKMLVLRSDEGGVELLSEIACLCPKSTVVAVSGHCDDCRTLAFVRLGIHVLPTPVSIDDLIEAMKLKRRAASSSSNEGNFENFCAYYGFSPREIDVFWAWLMGHERKQLSDVLAISQSSAGTYWSRMRKKVGVSSQGDLIRHFVRYLLKHDS
jgi:DNA-binding NarL/FixJ family response regulator